MGAISDFLWGRQTKIQDEKIGELTTRVKSENPSINYTWTGEHKLTGQAKPTVFILEGNSKGPYNEQLSCVHKIVDTLNDIILQVDKEIKGRPDIKQRFKREWAKEFYLAAINPYEPDKRGIETQFEINFEPIREDDTDFIGLLWSNGRLKEIKAK